MEARSDWSTVTAPVRTAMWEEREITKHFSDWDGMAMKAAKLIKQWATRSESILGGGVLAHWRSEGEEALDLMETGWVHFLWPWWKK